MDAPQDLALRSPQLASGAAALLTLTVFGAVGWAQPTQTRQEGTRQIQNDELVPAQGPDGGAIHAMTWGSSVDGIDPFVLTDAGVYRFDFNDNLWRHQVVRPSYDTLDGGLPLTVDPVHAIEGLGSYQGFYGPQDVQLLVSSRYFFILNQRGELYRALRGGLGRWTRLPRKLPDEIGLPSGITGGTPLRLSAVLGRSDNDQIFVLTAQPGKGDNPQESSLLWSLEGDAEAWGVQPWPGRSVLVQTGRSTVGAVWRFHGLTPSLKVGEERYQVARFLRIRVAPQGQTRFQEIDWVALMRLASREVRQGCRDATGMLESQTTAGDGEPPVLVAVGARTLCVSTDGGASFQVRDGLLRPSQPRDRIGDIISAVAFAHSQAPAGVRLLVGTDGLFNPVAPASRANGGRLFMSDNAGVSWQEVTPDIESGGGVLGLSAGPSNDARTVWLHSARRGLYRGVEGIGFSRSNQGIEAMPIHALAADPFDQDKVWAASPYGLYSSGGAWTRSQVTATRSLGRWPANKTHRGQLWAGTYWGVVLLKEQGGGMTPEKLPPLSDTDPAPLPLEVVKGTLPRSVPNATGVRPVALVTPTGLDERQGDTGYALEVGEQAGVHRRSGGAWERLPPPTRTRRETLKIYGLVAAPLAQRPYGAALLGTETLKDGEVRGVVWLHRPESGWVAVPTPRGDVPVAALRAGDKLWVVTNTGQLAPLLSAQATPTFGAPVDGEHLCRGLGLRADGLMACMMAPEGVRVSDDDKTPVNKARPIARALLMPPGALRSEMALPGERQRWRYLAPNPLGASFGELHAWTYSHIDKIGEQLWISPGLGVYTRPPALTKKLPYVPEDEQGKSGAVAAQVIPAAAALGVLALLIGAVVWWRRRDN